MIHDWECFKTGELHCCKRCGATAEITADRSGYVYSRPECFEVANVVSMTLRRARQLKDRITVRKPDGSLAHIPVEPA